MSIDWLSIDFTTFNVPVKIMKRSADMLYKYAERTNDGVLHSELIGVYFNYQLEFGRVTPSDYAALWAKLTEPVESHVVTLPDEDGQHTYKAYFSNIKDGFAYVENDEETRYLKNLTCNMIAIEPARTPS